MRFRTALLVGVLLLLTGVIAATVGVVGTVLSRAARTDLAADVARSRTVFEELRAYRESLYRSECHVVAEEPRLKAVVATEDVSRETVMGVAFDLKKALASDIFLLTDGKGRLLADMADPKAEGFDMSKVPLVAGALEKEEQSGLWTRDGHAYQVHARRLAFGTTTVGVLVIGYELNDRMAGTVQGQTGADVVIELDGKTIAATTFEGGAAVDRAALSAALRGVPDGQAEPVEVSIGPARYLASAARISGHAGDAKLRYVVLRSLDHALAPARSMTRALWGIGAGGLLAALVIATVLSRRLSRPLDDLVAFTSEIAAGRLAERKAFDGPVEVRTLGEAMNRMVKELDHSRSQIAAKERLEKEMEIGARIQTSILPRKPSVEGLEIAARMVPATEVGGDYYDVVPVEGGSWIGIGDVAGHGLSAGLVMLMIQSALSALGSESPGAAPRELLMALNRVLYENIRQRLANDEHVTLTLIRYHRDGRLVFAGAHEEMVICRADTGRCEMVETPGTWLGARPDIRRATVDTSVALRDGDILFLYTDGVTEAKDAAGAQLGIERVCEIIAARRTESAEEIVSAVMSAVQEHTAEQVDDVTAMVVRYRT